MPAETVESARQVSFSAEIVPFLHDVVRSKSPGFKRLQLAIDIPFRMACRQARSPARKAARGRGPSLKSASGESKRRSGRSSASSRAVI